MATYVVRVCDDNEGYADETVMGGFRTREAAEEFADKVRRRIKTDEIGVNVNLVLPPRVGTLRAEGWFDERDNSTNPYDMWQD